MALRRKIVAATRGWTESSDEGMKFFMAIVASVDRVYDDPVLRGFWRRGRLVPNRARRHPYQTGVPEEYRDADRWFLLDADCNPATYPWKADWEVPVFALALEQGEAPNREWLVYAHSPLEDRPSVTLTVPEFGDVKVEVSRGGSFYVLREGKPEAHRVGKL